MSFGASPSDIIIVVTFCHDLYKKCRDAGGEYDEISREVRGLHTTLKHLKSEVEDSDSLLNRDHSIWGKQLAPIIGDCDFTLRQLDELLLKYGRLASNGSTGSSGGRILWDKMRFGSNEMDQLGGIRVKLISHKTSLALFLDTIQLHENGKMSKNLDLQGEQLDIILDKVDSIAAKIGQRAGTIMTHYDDDDQEVWKQFRRELVAEGFSSDVLQQHKDVLRAYIRQMEEDGLLVEAATSPQVPSSESADTERWINSTPLGSRRPDTNRVQDDGAKEMIMREDNTKFPMAMKMQRPQPDSWMDVYSERQSTPKRTSHIPPVLKVDTTNFNEPKWQKETSGSSSDTPSIRRTLSSSNSSIIQTSDLAGSLLTPPTPSDYYSQPEQAGRPISLRPKRRSDLRTSPRTSAMDIPGRHSSPQIGRTDTSPETELKTSSVAFDLGGNEIPTDAKWTKVKRSLVSTEVLDQDGRRYEARPEFVAILGILTKEEIQEYASRSHILREERWIKHQASIASPASPVRQSRSRHGMKHGQRRLRDSSTSASSYSSSESTSDVDSDVSDVNAKRGVKYRDGVNGNESRRNRRDGRREERREKRDKRERDPDSSYIYTPKTYPLNPAPSSPHANSNTPRPWPIPTASPQYSGSPHQYSSPSRQYPPPFSPRQGYAPPFPQQQRLHNPEQQFLSPQFRPYPPNGGLSPHSRSPSFNPNNSFFPPTPSSYTSSSHQYLPTYLPNDPDPLAYGHPSHPRRRHHHHSSHSTTHSPSSSHRDPSRESHSSSGKFGKAPTTGSRWRDHLTAAGMGGAAVGLLGILSDAADGF